MKGIPHLPMATVAVNKPYLLGAISLTIGVFYFGGQPWSARIGATVPQGHWIAHFISFAIVSMSYARALPRIHPLVIACLGTAIGGFHELYQLMTPGHDAELGDFLINTAGAVSGGLASRFVFALLERSPRAS